VHELPQLCDLVTKAFSNTLYEKFNLIQRACKQRDGEGERERACIQPERERKIEHTNSLREGTWDKVNMPLVILPGSSSSAKKALFFLACCSCRVAERGDATRSAVDAVACGDVTGCAAAATMCPLVGNCISCCLGLSSSSVNSCALMCQLTAYACFLFGGFADTCWCPMSTVKCVPDTRQVDMWPFAYLLATVELAHVLYMDLIDSQEHKHMDIHI
jgi:hypothetical protein